MRNSDQKGFTKSIMALASFEAKFQPLNYRKASVVQPRQLNTIV